MRNPLRFGLLLMCLAALLTTRQAVAQGTDGLVTCPMGLRAARELVNRYAQLRKEQFPLLESAHDQYLEKFTVLRDGPVKEYLQEILKMNAGATGQIPEIDVVKGMFEKGERINRRVASVDDEFFRNVTIMLDEDQAQGVARARTARKRKRNSSNQMSFGVSAGLRPVDEAYWSIELQADEHARVEAQLRSYELAMATMTADRLKAANRSTLSMIESLSELGFAGFTNEDMRDPEKSQAFMVAIQEAMARSMVGLAEIQIEIDEREMSMAIKLMSVLPSKKAHQLMKIWVSEAASMGLEKSGVHGLEIAHRKMVSSGKLDESELEAIEVIMSDWRGRDIKYLLDLATEIQMIGQMVYSGGGMNDPESMGLAYQGLISINTMRGESSEAAKNRIAALLGEERAAEFDRHMNKKLHGEPENAAGVVQGEVVVVGSTGAGEHFMSEVSSGPVGAVIPGAIQFDDLAFYIELLQLDDDEATILEALHSAYLAEWEVGVDEIEKRASEIIVWTVEEQLDAATVFDKEAFEIKWGLFTEARAASLQLDDGFLSDVKEIAKNPREDRFGAARQYRAFQRVKNAETQGNNPLYFGLHLNLPNPYMTPELISLAPASREAVFDLLVSRQQDLAPAIDGYEEELFRRSHKQARDGANMFFNNVELESDGEAMARMQEQYAETMAAFQQQSQALVRRTEIVRSLVSTEMAVLMDEEDRLKIPVVFYAQITGAKDAPMQAMRRISGMGDLREEQRVVIAEVFSRHLESDGEYAMKLAILLSKELPPSSSQMESFAGSMELRGQIERLEFRRSELEERLFERILGILSPEQGVRISSLRGSTGS